MEDLYGPEIGEVDGGCGFRETSGEAGTYLIVQDDGDRVRVCERAMVEEVVVAESWTTVDADEGSNG